MMTGLENGPWMNTGDERTRAMTLYVRAFFRSMDAGSLSRLIAEAREHGQQKIVEELYSAGVITNIVRAILGRIDKGRYVGDQAGDYVQDATVVLMQIARQGRLDLTKSAGEIASYICLWIEQRVKRVARKDQYWRFSLSDSPGDMEKVPDVDDQPDFDEAPSRDVADDEAGIGGKLSAPSPASLTKTKLSPVAGNKLRKSERNIMSIFGSSRSGET